MRLDQICATIERASAYVRRPSFARGARARDTNILHGLCRPDPLFGRCVASYVLELMSGGWFMPYCIVTFSALARLHALLRTGAETIRDRMVDAGASSEFPSFIGSLHWKDMARSSRTVAAAASVVAQRAAAQAPAVPAPAKEQGDVVEAAVPKPAAKAKPGLADADDLGGTPCADVRRGTGTAAHLREARTSLPWWL